MLRRVTYPFRALASEISESVREIARQLAAAVRGIAGWAAPERCNARHEYPRTYGVGTITTYCALEPGHIGDHDDRAARSWSQSESSSSR